VNRRERWAKWTGAAVAGLPVLYVASFGPACWWFSTDNPPGSTWPRYGDIVTLSSAGSKYVPKVYWPLASAAQHGPRWLRESIDWYATLHGGKIAVPSNWAGNSYLILSAGYLIPSASDSDEDEAEE
jgi:hypothetical protein